MTHTPADLEARADREEDPTLAAMLLAGAKAMRRVEELEARLGVIADSYDARSELFTSDAECAANLAGRARLAAYEEKRNG